MYFPAMVLGLRRLGRWLAYELFQLALLGAFGLKEVINPNHRLALPMLNCWELPDVAVAESRPAQPDGTGGALLSALGGCGHLAVQALQQNLARVRRHRYIHRRCLLLRRF